MSRLAGTSNYNKLEALVFSTDTGSVEVYSGNTGTIQSVPAGLTAVNTELTVGVQAAILKRSGQTVASVTSTHAVESVPYVQDYLYRISSSLRDSNEVTVPELAPPGATTIAINSVADTYVQGAGNASLNYGTDANLSARGTDSGSTAIALMRFVIPEQAPEQVVTDARLFIRTTPSVGGSAFNYDVLLWDNNWNESTVTWNTRPTTAGAVLGTLYAPTSDTSYWFDLTNHTALTPFIGQEITIAVRNNNNQADGLFFWSNQHGNSENHVRLELTYDIDPPDTTPPSQPTGLAATKSGYNVSLTWTASTDDTAVTSYEVHRSLSSGFTPSGGTLIGSNTSPSYSDNGLSVNTYYYKVVANDQAGNASTPSTQASIVITAAPVVQTIEVLQDVYVNQGVPSANFGASGSLASGGSGNAQIYLRFDLPSAPAGQTLTSAVLKYRTTTLASAGSTSTHNINLLGSNSWVEGTQDGSGTANGVTWNTRPSITGALLGTISAPSTETAYSSVLDHAVVAPLAGGQVSIAISASPSNADNIWIWSKANFNATWRPILELTYE
jgi:hypothetical protein